MNPGDEWNARMMFDRYLHDYMLRKKMYKAAEIFRNEADLPDSRVVIDAPDGVLSEWWSLFYDVYMSRTKQIEVNGNPSVQATHMVPDGQQSANNLAPPQLNMMSEGNPGQIPKNTKFDMLLANPTACLLAAKNFEEERRNSGMFDPNLRMLDVNLMNLPSLIGTRPSHIQQMQSNQGPQMVMTETREGIAWGPNAANGPTLHGIQHPRVLLPSNGLHNSGLNHGVNPVQLQGWPLGGFNQIPNGLRHQVLNSFVQTPNHQQQIQTLAQNQQGVFAHPGQSMQSYSGMSTNMINSDLVMSNNNIMDPRNERKRKLASNAINEGNTLGCNNIQEDRSIEENIESFLSQEEHADNSSVAFSLLKRQAGGRNNNINRGFSFEQVCRLHSSKSKLLCCHFSSGGSLLASAGHDKKVYICNVDTFEVTTTLEGHSHLISDVRFRSNSTVLATSSFDRSVQIWDATRPNQSLFKLLGHTEQVMSLDFHPRKGNLLCSCDSNDEIRLWNINQSSCARVSKGANRQVRFQPITGDLLATAIGNRINLIDIESGELQLYFEGHAKEVRSICWDTSGKYIASVSEDSARIWSVGSGKCVHELFSDGHNFQSCTFHPGYFLMLVIGGYQNIHLWNPTESSKRVTYAAHSGYVAALASSTQREFIASASHDKCVKLWK